MKKIAIIVAVVLIAVLVIRLAMPGDQKRIVKTILKGRDAIEQENADELMSVISLSYRDEYGMAYVPVKRLFMQLFEQFENSKIGCTFTSIEIANDTADVTCDIWWTTKIRGREYSLIGKRSSPEKLILTLAKGELAWKVISSKWQSFPSVESLIAQPQFQ
jgi:hypothetical protein